MLISMVNGLPYAHPILIILALMLGSWLTAIVRTINNLSRPLWAILRRI